jgi:hypothetical protein
VTSPDTNVRELELRWRKTGSTDDETAYLLGRLRCGELERSQLELAAHCGSQAASRAVGAAPAVLSFRDWADQLSDQPRGLHVRVGVAAVRAAFTTFVDATSFQSSELALVQSVVAACEAWVDCPCERHALAAEKLAPPARVHPPGKRGRIPAPEGWSEWLLDLVRGGAPHGLTQPLVNLAKKGWNTLDQTALRHVIEAEVVPWALGHGDPVRERVEARQREEGATT